MTTQSNSTTSDFRRQIRTTPASQHSQLRSVRGIEYKAHTGFSAKRKFLGVWSYEKTADGTVYLNTILDQSR